MQTLLNKNEDKIKKIICFLVALVAIFMSMTAFINVRYEPVLGNLSTLFTYFTTVIFFVYLLLTKKLIFKNIYLIAVPVAYLTLLILNTYGGYTGYYLTAFILSCSFLLSPKEIKVRIFKYYYYIVLITTAISIVLYLLYVLDINIGFKEVEYYRDYGSGLDKYIKYFIFAIYKHGDEIRLCGLFNEPGKLGTYLALLYIIKNNDTSVLEKFILLMGGLLTTSFSFFILISIYYFTKFFILNKKIAICITLLLISFLFITPSIDFHNQTLNSFFGRFELTDVGLLAGNNRTNKEFDVAFDELLSSNKVFFGNGFNSVAQIKNANASSYKSIIYEFGIVGFLTLISLYIYTGIRLSNRSKNSIIFIALFFLSAIQRPLIFLFFYFLIYYGGILYMSDVESTNNNSVKLEKNIKTIVKKTLSFLPDKYYLKLKYYVFFHKKLDLNNPITYNEKLQWLKLYDRNPLYTMLVDKYRVKEYVENKIGKEYVVPLFGVWNSVEEINIEELPEQFVLKCSHDCGGIRICKDKKKFDLDEAKKFLKKQLKTNYYYDHREWPYKDVKPVVFAEKYLEDNNSSDLRDYKFFCFDGEPKLMFVASDRNNANEETKFDFFDMDYNFLNIINGHPNSIVLPDKPINFELMKKLSAELSKNIPQVRVDFYEIDGNVYFGEMTFFHFSGFVPFEPETWDYKIGEYLNLPKKK